MENEGEGGGGNGGGGGGGGGQGELFGDLWVLTRDLDPADGGGDGEPALDVNGQVIPIGFDAATGAIFPIYLVEGEEGDFSVPVDLEPFVQEVDLERANLIRAPESVRANALEEALAKIEGGTTISTDAAGRIAVDGVLIDSPRENLALYDLIMKAGGANGWTDVLDGAAANLPAPIADLLASGWNPTGLLGGAFSKFTPITLDAVITAHTLMGVNEATEIGGALVVDFFSFTAGGAESFDYDRVERYGDLWLRWFQDMDGDPSDLEAVERTLLDAVWGSDADGDGVNDVGSGVNWTDETLALTADGLGYETVPALAAGVNDWAQSVDDARAVILFAHETVGAVEIEEPVNEAPTAGNDAAATSEDAAVAIDVLVNDSDPDGDELVVETFSQGAHGNVAAGPEGALVYTPDPDFSGEDSFSYEVSDGKGGRASATVTVVVASIPDAPSAADDAARTLIGTAVTVDVLANDEDADGDAISISAFGQGAHGSVTAGTGGTLVYTPDPAFVGEDSFTYEATDGTGLSSVATVSVTVAVNPPLDGNMVLDGGGAADRMTGGDGDDEMHGHAGNDTLEGAEGDDWLTGDQGADELHGGEGDDIMSGGGRGDMILGGPGRDRMYGDRGDDTLDGGADDDLLIGGTGDDKIYGRHGNDTLDGGAGDDTLCGGPGDDALFGGDGADRLKGGAGSDILEGGDGADRFVFFSVDPVAVDTILDFSFAASDRVRLTAIDADGSTQEDDAFAFIGYVEFSGVAGELRAVDLGGVQRVEGDVDGDGLADLTIDIVGADPVEAGWFVL